MRPIPNIAAVAVALAIAASLCGTAAAEEKQLFQISEIGGLTVALVVSGGARAEPILQRSRQLASDSGGTVSIDPGFIAQAELNPSAATENPSRQKILLAHAFSSARQIPPGLQIQDRPDGALLLTATDALRSRVLRYLEINEMLYTAALQRDGSVLVTPGKGMKSESDERQLEFFASDLDRMLREELRAPFDFRYQETPAGVRLTFSEVSDAASFVDALQRVASVEGVQLSIVPATLMTIHFSQEQALAQRAPAKLADNLRRLAPK